MKKHIILWLILLCMCSTSFAEEIPSAVQSLIPPEATITCDQSLGEFRALILELPSGESMQLMLNNRSGTAISLSTQIPAPFTADAPQDRASLEAILQKSYPDAHVFAIRDGESGEKILSLFTPDLCGEISVDSSGILSRNLNCGLYSDQQRLTMAGALAVLQLHRPDADFRALELDEEDGVLVYEGDAYIDDVEYEFELNASTGRLLEWERD